MAGWPFHKLLVTDPHPQQQLCRSEPLLTSSLSLPFSSYTASSFDGDNNFPNANASLPGGSINNSPGYTHSSASVARCCSYSRPRTPTDLWLAMQESLAGCE